VTNDIGQIKSRHFMYLQEVTNDILSDEIRKLYIAAGSYTRY